MSLFFEDFKPGDTFETASVEVDRESILDFARKFDPQPFHLDDEAAKSTIYGGIIASGWHTAAICHRLLVDHMGPSSGSMGSPGADEIRWKKPVRPGDRLRLKGTILAVTPSTSKPDRGSVKLAYELSNQDGEVVMTVVGNGIFKKRG